MNIYQTLKKWQKIHKKNIVKLSISRPVLNID